MVLSLGLRLVFIQSYRASEKKEKHIVSLGMVLISFWGGGLRLNQMNDRGA